MEQSKETQKITTDSLRKIYELEKDGALKLIKKPDNLNQMVEKEFHFRKASE